MHYAFKKFKSLFAICLFLIGTMGLYAQTVLVEFTNPGSDTWTVPSGVTEIAVRIWGAGGGSGGHGTASVTAGGNGEASIFSDISGPSVNLSAGGGTGTAGAINNTPTTGGIGGLASGGDINIDGVVGTDGLIPGNTSTGGTGGSSPNGGGTQAGASPPQGGNSLPGVTGNFQGGGAGGSARSNNAAGGRRATGGGGGGAYVEIALTVSAGDEFAFAVGAGGAAGGGNQAVGGAGANGKLEIEYTNLCASFVITEGDVINPSCFEGGDGEASVVVTGGSGSYTFSWENSGSTDSVRTGLVAGTYKVYVNDGVCLDSLTFNLGQPAALSIQLEQQINESCPGAEDGSIEITVTGGTGSLSFLWSNGATTAEITDLTVGPYSLTVTDINVCEATESYSINTSFSNPTVSASNDGPYCEDDTIELSASGGTSYEWSGPDMFTSTDEEPTRSNATIAMGGIYSVTVTDANGCSGIAMTEVVVNDCSVQVTVSGTISWSSDQNQTVNEVDVNATGDGMDSDQTEPAGSYELNLPQGGNYTITPSKTTGVLNGADIADALAIQQHVTFIQRFTDPYQLIAADVSGDEVISTFDALIIAQTLIGNPFAVALFEPSWRFVPADYVFPDPLSPWGFPETIEITDLQTDLEEVDFIGIKIGDVTGDADPSDLLPQIPTRDLQEKLVWQVSDKQWNAAGELIEVNFSSGYFQNFASWQMGLQFDPSALEFVEVLAEGSALNMGPNNFGSFKADEGELRAVWFNSSGLNKDLAEGEQVFTYVFRSLTREGKISDYLWIEDAVIPARTYDQDFQLSGIDLEFVEAGAVSVNDPTTTHFRLMQNRPNPFDRFTIIGFELPESSSIQLRITDMAGKTVKMLEGDFRSGYNEIKLDLDLSSGMYFYELILPFGSLTGQMVRQ